MQLIELHAFCVYGVLGFYAFSVAASDFLNHSVRLPVLSNVIGRCRGKPDNVIGRCRGKPDGLPPPQGEEKKGLTAPQPSLGAGMSFSHVSALNSLFTSFLSFSLKDEGLFHANSCRKRTATAGDFLQETASGLAGDCQRS